MSCREPRSWKVKIPATGQVFKSVTVLGTDATDDVALLQLNGATGLHPVPRGNSSLVRKGDTVVALGNAEGRDGKPTVVAGSVTATDQSIRATDEGAGTTENLHGMLETNAPIVSGDSGGALANLQGQVIGMNTAANSSGAPSIGGGPSRNEHGVRDSPQHCGVDRHADRPQRARAARFRSGCPRSWA